jgi:hypothetical protein
MHREPLARQRNVGEQCSGWAAVVPTLALAFGAVMGSAASNEDTANWRLAAAAGFAGAQVDTVFKLKKAARAIGINVIRNRGTAELNGVGEDLAQRQPQAVEFGAGDAIGPTAGPDAGMKEAFVGVDVAHASEKRLVEQGRLDV